MVRRNRSTNEVPQLVQQLKMVKDQQDIFGKRYTEVKARLFELLDADGIEDDKGHLIIELDEPVDGVASIIKQRRASVKLNEDALAALLKEKGLYDDCTKTVVVLDEDKVHDAIYRGLITEDEFETCVTKSVSWSLVQGKA